MPISEQDRTSIQSNFSSIPRGKDVVSRSEEIFNKPIITDKFGGTSVGDARRIEVVSGIVLKQLSEGVAVVVVVSAMSGITNKLVDLSNENLPQQDKDRTIREVIDRHTTATTEMLLSPSRRHALSSDLNILFRMLRADVEDTSVSGNEKKDRILSYGERMSSRLVAASLVEHGVRSHVFESTSIIATDDQFG